MTLSYSYSQALLSDLSYVSLTPNPQTDEERAANIFATRPRLGGVEADAAAGAVLKEWQPVATLNDPSGAQATVFHNAATNAYTIAVRGTEPAAEDYAQDLLLAVGVPPSATPQFIALKGWLDGLFQPVPEGGDPQFENQGLLAGKTVNFTGHSLGGYLAAAAHQTYSSADVATIGTAYVFNAPGVGGVLGTASQFFLDVLGVEAPTSGNIVNIESSEGLRVTAAAGFEPAVVTKVQTPESTSIGDWHAISHLRDALLVASAFEGAMGLPLPDFNKLVDSFSGGIGGAMTYLLWAVTGSPTLSNNYSPIDGTWSSLYQASTVIAENSSKITGYSLLSDAWATQALDDSPMGAAVRTALQELSPIAIHTETPALIENDRTPLYWQQRMEMVKRLSWFNENDINPYTTETPTTPDGSGAGLHIYQTDATIFRDRSSGVTIQQGPDTPSMSRIVFGATGPSTEIVGGGVGDFLFSSGGTEVLRGEYGADYLEGYGGGDQLIGGQGDDVLVGLTPADGRGYHFDGGTDNDTISGSANADTYVYRSGDGQDVIQEVLDVAGVSDSLRLQGVNVANTTFSLSGTSLHITTADGGRIEVLGWGTTGGERGRIERLAFDDATLTADAVDAILAGALMGTEGDNTLAVPASPAGLAVFGLGGADRLYGSNTVSSWLYGGAGTDRLYAGAKGDFLDGGSDNDYLYGSTNQDTLLGGAGGDYLSGGGNTGALGDYFEGGAGSDQITGTAGADTYVVNVGDGMDYLTESANATVVDTLNLAGAAGTVTRSGTSLVIRNSTGDGVTINNWYTTADSTANQIEHVTGAFNLSAAELTALGLVVQGRDTNAASSYNNPSETLVGLAAFRNELYGNGGSDRLEAGSKGDLLNGGADNDMLLGGAGRDTLLGGAGNDYISGWSNTDGSGDYFEGGTGSDAIYGTSGADTFKFNAGDGFDYIYETSNASAIDRLLVESLQLDRVVALRSGNDLRLYLGAPNDGVQISGWYSGNQIEEVSIGGATLSNTYLSEQGQANFDAGWTPQSDPVFGGLYLI